MYALILTLNIALCGVYGSFFDSFDWNSIENLSSSGATKIPWLHYSMFNTEALLKLSNCLRNSSNLNIPSLELWDIYVRGNDREKLAALNLCDHSYTICAPQSTSQSVDRYIAYLIYSTTFLCAESKKEHKVLDPGVVSHEVENPHGVLDILISLCSFINVFFAGAYLYKRFLSGNRLSCENGRIEITSASRT